MAEREKSRTFDATYIMEGGGGGGGGGRGGEGREEDKG